MIVLIVLFLIDSMFAVMLAGIFGFSIAGTFHFNHWETVVTWLAVYLFSLYLIMNGQLRGHEDSMRIVV